jgi:hypothetical protein
MKKYKFKAKIQAGEGGGAYLVFPFDTEKEFGTKGKVPVHATLDGVPERSALFRYGPPQHLLAVRKAIRDQIGKKPGDTVEVVLWKDEEIRTIEVPAEFTKRNNGVRPAFGARAGFGCKLHWLPRCTGPSRERRSAGAPWGARRIAVLQSTTSGRMRRSATSSGTRK